MMRSGLRRRALQGLVHMLRSREQLALVAAGTDKLLRTIVDISLEPMKYSRFRDPEQLGLQCDALTALLLPQDVMAVPRKIVVSQDAVQGGIGRLDAILGGTGGDDDSSGDADGTGTGESRSSAGSGAGSDLRPAMLRREPSVDLPSTLGSNVSQEDYQHARSLHSVMHRRMDVCAMAYLLANRDEEDARDLLSKHRRDAAIYDLADKKVKEQEEAAAAAASAADPADGAADGAAQGGADGSDEADTSSLSGLLADARRAQELCKSKPLIPAGVYAVPKQNGSESAEQSSSSADASPGDAGGSSKFAALFRRYTSQVADGAQDHQLEADLKDASDNARAKRLLASGAHTGVLPNTARALVGQQPAAVALPVDCSGPVVANPGMIKGCTVVVAGCHGGHHAAPLGDKALYLACTGGPMSVAALTGMGVIGYVTEGGRARGSPGTGRVRVTVPAGGDLGGTIEIAVPLGRLGLLTAPYGIKTMGTTQDAVST